MKKTLQVGIYNIPDYYIKDIFKGIYFCLNKIRKDNYDFNNYMEHIKRHYEYIHNIKEYFDT